MFVKHAMSFERDLGYSALHNFNGFVFALKAKSDAWLRKSKIVVNCVLSSKRL